MPRARSTSPDLSRFPGISFSSSDFSAVRDGRRSPMFFVDVDLSVGRAVGNNTQAELPIAANFLYVDQKQNTGFATIHFQDTNPLACPITIFAGALWKVPFTKFAIENAAQPGMVMRLIYGVDVDALPISAAGVTVLNSINVADFIGTNAQYVGYANAGEPVGLTVTPIVLPAANVSGVAVREFYMTNGAGAGGSVSQMLIAGATAPVGSASKANAVLFDKLDNSATALIVTRNSALNRRIPSAWGIWNLSGVNVAPANVGIYMTIEIL